MADLDPELLRLATGQHGMLTTRQARAVGVGPFVLERLVDEDALWHPCRGLYGVAALVDDTPQARHRALSAGAHLIYGDAVLTGVSAVLAHGLPVWGVGLERVAIHRPIDRGVGVKAFHVRSVPSTPGRPEPVETPWGRADDPATALVQHTMDAGTTAGVVSADAALHDGVVGEQQLREATGVVATWPRASKARAMVELVDGRSESVGESRCRVELDVHGIAATPQVEIRDHRDRFVARVDLLVDGTRVVVEFDGRVKYDSGDPAVLWAEKKREDRLRALGYRVVRITWADLETPGAVVAKVRRAMAVPA